MVMVHMVVLGIDVVSSVVKELVRGCFVILNINVPVYFELGPAC